MNVKTLHTIIQNILLFLAVALLPAALPAQKLQITEATAAMEPMTVPMQRLDFNNQICALVKVVLPVAGVQFEGNVVGEPVFKTSEYWVYLTPGTKMLKIKAPGHYPVMADFRTLGVGPLESKTIYYVTLEAEGSGPVKPAMETNYAVLTVQPPTATVKIDGQPQPVEDGSVIVLLKLGEHTWQAEAVGYASDSGTFRITPTDKTNVSVQLKSQKATLTVNTVADATVYINGRQQGSGNRTLELLPGIYNVELRRQGYKPYTQTVELQASQTAQVSCTEFTPVYGMLSVNYRPVGSTITLNGRQIGTTPANLNDVNIGTYTLAISAPNYITHTQPVTITETTPVTLSGSLQKQPSATAPVPPTTTTTQTTAPTSSTLSGTYSTTPINLALCAKLNGKTVYITPHQWKAMSATEQAAFTKKGLCIIDDYKGTKYSFLLELDNRGYMTWEEAMRKYAKYLPTSEQSRVMRNNRDGIYSAINTFGGEEPGGCWTSEQYEYRESEALYFDMYINSSDYVKKSKQYEVRRVFTTPSTAATTSTTTTSATPVKYSTTPINLALCAELNGKVVYITQNQWKAMSQAEQGAFTKKGLCIIDIYYGKTYCFLLALNEIGKGMKWEEAMLRYGNSLPTKEQAEVMAKNYIAINTAIIALGGDKDPAFGYWTRKEFNYSEAWYVHMIYGVVGTNRKTSTYGVRAVTPVDYHDGVYTTPINLALCAELNGKVVYITQDQWEAMSATLQASCHKKGLCLIGKNEQFLLALDENSEKINWTKATQEYGKRLPTHDQAKVISENWEYLDKALTVFGASELKNYNYWTSSSYDKKSAYYISNFGSISVSLDSKKEKMYVRTVEPIPDVP